MTALRKGDGGVRSIVVGDVIRRLVARTIAQTIGPGSRQTQHRVHTARVDRVPLMASTHMTKCLGQQCCQDLTWRAAVRRFLSCGCSLVLPPLIHVVCPTRSDSEGGEGEALGRNRLWPSLSDRLWPNRLWPKLRF